MEKDVAKTVSNESAIRSEIVKAGKKLAERFFVAANDGNISCRIGENEILITPTGVNKGDIREEDILKVDMEGNVISGTMSPTSEMKMHLRVYEIRSDVKAIVHAHPPTITGYAACRIPLDREILLPEAIFNLGRIGLTDYATPTTDEVPESVARIVKDCDAIMLANHGALTVGSTVMDAYYKMETLEMYARINLTARLLGKPAYLNEGQIERLFAIREERGWGTLRSGSEVIDEKLVESITEIVVKVLQSHLA